MKYKVIDTKIITTKLKPPKINIAKIDTLRNLLDEKSYKVQINSEKYCNFRTRKEVNQFLMNYFY